MKIRLLSKLRAFFDLRLEPIPKPPYDLKREKEYSILVMSAFSVGTEESDDKVQEKNRL